MKLKTLPENQVLNCLNCGSKINTSNTYCEKCGQEIKDYRLSIWKLIKEMFSSIFNMDSKFFKTIFNIWRPVFLTKAYVKGERKTYLNPGRFFIVSFFILSAILSIYMKVNMTEAGELDDRQRLYTSEIKQDMIQSYDSLTQVYKLEPANLVDSLRYEMFLSEQKMAEDSIASPPNLIQYTDDDGVTSGSVKEGYNIATKDILHLSKEELIEKYEVEGLGNQVALIQYLKFKKNPTNWLVFMLTNSLWTIVLSTFVLAFFMKLLYIRQFYFYVEHMIFLMTFQSLVFLAVTISIGLNFLVKDSMPFLLMTIWTISSIWFIKSLKEYYRQPFFKTIFKSLLIFIVHILILSFCLALVIGASFFLY